MDDIVDIHHKYLESHPENPIGKSKFFELRLLWVIPMQKQSQDVCRCIYHENIDLICQALTNKARKDKIQLNFKEVSTADDIWQLTACDIYIKDCVWRYSKCKASNISKLFPFQDVNSEIKYNQQENVIVERKDKPDTRATRKNQKHGSVKGVIKHLSNLLHDLSIHNHTNINQLHNFKQAKKNLQKGEILISEDLSENYRLKHQNEIMSARWSQDELLLFCATINYKVNAKVHLQHYVLCSDDLGHGKNSIFFYNSFIVNNLKAKGLHFDFVHYRSDGLSSQFKNQYNFTKLKFHDKGHGMMAEWNFFATSHDKGENDGVGGNVQNGVWQRVLQQKEVVGDLQSFVAIAQEKFPSFKIVAFTSDEIQEATSHLKERYQKFSTPLPNTQKFHHIRIEENKVTGVFLTKFCPCHNKEATDNDNDDDDDDDDECKESKKPIIGQFYHVKYNFFDTKGNVIAKILPAMCSENDLEEHLFTFMKTAKKNKYTFDTTNQAWIHQDDVVRLLAFPNLTRQGEYK